jgi:uncharacterized damage-inducible protein DinB
VWAHEAPRTVRIVSIFDDCDLPFRPFDGARSIGELMAHLADSCQLTQHWLTATSAAWATTAIPPTDVGRAVVAVADAHRALFDTLRQLSNAEFNTVIAPFGAPEPRSVMALGMFKHELHHRGELYALARVRGHRPPGLYDQIAAAGGYRGI